MTDQPPTSQTSEHQPYKKTDSQSHRRWCTACGVEWPCLARKLEVIHAIKLRNP